MKNAQIKETIILQKCRSIQVLYKECLVLPARMYGMTYRGKIFKIRFPFTDLSGFKARPALAISEPDEYGDIEFLFITTIRE